MFLILLLLFTAFPALELYILVDMGQRIGAGEIIFIVILTGLIGSKFALSQGQHIKRQLEIDLQNGRMPADTLLHGIVVFIGGLLLITPGFISDLVGLLALFPFSRGIFLAFLKIYLSRKIQRGELRVVNFGRPPGAARGPLNSPPSEEEKTIIDITPESKD